MSETDFTCKLNDHLFFRILSGPEDSMESSQSFPPVYTYHAVGKTEEILGYENLEVLITFNGCTLEYWIDIQYTQQQPNAPDILQLLQPSLPGTMAVTEAAFLERLNTSRDEFVPPGTCMDSYSTTWKCQNGEALERCFEIYECSLENEAMQHLHEKMQQLALWFIEGADKIDTTDPKWTIFTLYETLATKDGKTYRIAGYVTRYTFYTPMRRGTNNSQSRSVRICQVVILPPFQRQGHGSRIIELIMKQARQDPLIYEVTVEDPVPEFTFLRNLLDLRTCIQYDCFPTMDAPVPLTSKQIEAVREVLKLTKTQIQLCYEVLLLQKLIQHDELQNETKYKPYRLFVKRRLYQLFLPEVEQCVDSIQKKRILEREYQIVETQYKALVQALRISLKSK